MNYLGNKARRFCAVVLGLVFFVAGILKLMDPVGTTLIIREYLNFLHISFLSGIAGFIAEAFASLETLLGICLITGVFRIVTAWASSILLWGFTLLTLLLWILNPNMDCGCFGEAFHLTHFQSFAKNIILCLIAFGGFFPYKDLGRPKNSKYVTFALTVAAVIAFAVYSLMFIPMLELTPFNLSSRLEAAEGLPESDEDEYISTFIYEKNGKSGVFTLNNIPDSTWTFVEAKTIKKEDNINESEFPRLSFRDTEGEYRDTLAAKGLVMAISVPEPKKMNAAKWEKTADLLKKSADAGLTALLLAGSSPDQFADIIGNAGVDQATSMQILTSVYYSDYKTLISLNRSNGGAVYFNDGNLISKWASRNLPSARKLAKIVRQDDTEVMLDSDSRGKLTFEAFMLYTLALMLIF